MKSFGFMMAFFIGTASLFFTSAQASTFFLGTGATLYNMGKITSTDDASTSLLGQFYLPLTLTASFSLNPRLKLIPQISYTPLGVKSADEITKRILTAGISTGYFTSPRTQLKTGLGLMSYSISGPGGTVQRSNGTSTSTFALPSTSVSTQTIYLDLGLAYLWGPFIRFDVDALVQGAFSSRRSFTTLISISRGVF